MAYTYADEKARKLRMGEPLNYGKPVAAPSAPRGAIPPSYAAAMPAPRPPSGVPASGVSSASKAGYPPPVMVQNSGGIKPPNVSNATKGAIPQTTPQAGVSNATMSGGIPNAANNQGGAPSLGYGAGGTYGQTSGLHQAYAANKQLISTDAGRQSEIDRTLAVIAARQAQGLDVSGQQKYLTVNLGYTPPQPAPDVQPETASDGAIPNMALTSDQIAQEADYALNKERADLVNTTNTQSNTTRNNAAYAAKLLQDSRVLQDQQMSRTLNPFSGRTTYDKAMVNRGRGIDDTYRAAELENQLNSISQDLYNFDKLAPDKRRALINEATRIEREFGIQEGTLTGNYKGGRTLAGAQYDRGIYEDERDFDYNAGRDQVLDSQWKMDFQEDKRRYGEDFAYKKARDKITDAQDKRDFDERVKQSGLDNAVQWYNANTSRQSSNNASKNANFSRLMDTWAATGKAPEGLKDFGITPGTAYKPESGEEVSFDQTPEWAQEISEVNNDPGGMYDDILKNAQDYIEAYTFDGYEKLLAKAKALRDDE